MANPAAPRPDTLTDAELITLLDSRSPERRLAASGELRRRRQIAEREAANHFRQVPGYTGKPPADEAA